MNQTMLLKLTPTPEQHCALLETMHSFNAACNYVAGVAFTQKSANKFALQKLVYSELRTTYKLAAQLAIRAISKASEAYKRDKSIQPTFRPEGAVVYDERVMTFKGLLTVSLLTLQGRVLVPFNVRKLSRGSYGCHQGTGRPHLPQGRLLPCCDPGSAYAPTARVKPPLSVNRVGCRWTLTSTPLIIIAG